MTEDLTRDAIEIATDRDEWGVKSIAERDEIGPKELVGEDRVKIQTNLIRSHSAKIIKRQLYQGNHVTPRVPILGQGLFGSVLLR